MALQHCSTTDMCTADPVFTPGDQPVSVITSLDVPLHANTAQIPQQGSAAQSTCTSGPQIPDPNFGTGSPSFYDIPQHSTVVVG